MESSVFAVTIAGVLAYDHGLSWRHYDRSYVGRNYFRVQDGVGRCAPAKTEVAAAARRLKRASRGRAKVSFALVTIC